MDAIKGSIIKFRESRALFDLLIIYDLFKRGIISDKDFPQFNEDAKSVNNADEKEYFDFQKAISNGCTRSSIKNSSVCFDSFFQNNTQPYGKVSQEILKLCKNESEFKGFCLSTLKELCCEFNKKNFLSGISGITIISSLTDFRRPGINLEREIIFSLLLIPGMEVCALNEGHLDLFREKKRKINYMSLEIKQMRRDCHSSESEIEEKEEKLRLLEEDIIKLKRDMTPRITTVRELLECCDEGISRFTPSEKCPFASDEELSELLIELGKGNLPDYTEQQISALFNSYKAQALGDQTQTTTETDVEETATTPSPLTAGASVDEQPQQGAQRVFVAIVASDKPIA